MLFNPDTQNLRCAYCGEGEQVVSDKKGYNIKIAYTPTIKFNESMAMENVYHCLSCGTKISIASNQTLTRCPSCGSKELKPVKETQIHPTNIVPFFITKEKAALRYQEWLGNRRFAPNDLKKMAKMQKISGSYVPIYLFDFKATTHYSAKGITEHKREDGSEYETSTTIRDVRCSQYANYICSANNKFQSYIFNNLGGYDNQHVVPYRSEYLLGFSGIGTDFSVQQSYANLNKEISSKEQNNILSKLRSRYDDVEYFNASTEISDIMCGYLYVPVWVNHYTYNNKNYHCYVNGQTGKVYGKTPKSFWKILGFVAGVVAGIALFVSLFI